MCASIRSSTGDRVRGMTLCVGVHRGSQAFHISITSTSTVFDLKELYVTPLTFAGLQVLDRGEIEFVRV